ncbi:MAG: hypothetical protein JAY97_11510 [Candidatus Thiodiazotropha sp. 'RUGA']|nr:hypothetical protein [Candidatus Thiodiazotropha sp. 'RUGA']
MTRSELKRRIKAAEDQYQKSLSSMTEDELNQRIQYILDKLSLPHPIDASSMTADEINDAVSDYM